MTKYKIKRFSVITTARGVRGRSLDQNLNKLQEGETKRALSLPNIFNEEMAELKNELKNLYSK
jgi:hypothetical protein